MLRQHFPAFYSLSNQILTERKTYYKTLKKIQFSDGDMTQ